jgi:hypothetical protein
MPEEDAAAMLERLVAQCDESAANAKARGRRYYFVSYTLMVLSVAGSIGAGVMALWNDAVPREWVGTVALLPALCATVAMQLRLNEKGNFSYRRYRAFHALARRVEVGRLRAPTLETLEGFNAEHAKINDSLDEQWVENLNFNFNASARE